MPLNQQKLETDLFNLFNATQSKTTRAARRRDEQWLEDQVQRKTTRAARRQFCEEFAKIICDCIRSGDVEVIASRDLGSLTTSLGATLSGGPVILKMK